LDSNGGGYRVLHEFEVLGETRLQTPVAHGDHVYGVMILGSPRENGAIYRVGRDGQNFEVLHTFTNDANEGYFPREFAIDDSTIYGSVPGGSSTVLGSFTGSVYKMNTDGSGFEVLHDFPLSGAIGLHVDGSKLYGLTREPSGATAVFQMNTDGTDYHLLHSFADRSIRYGGTWITVIDGQIFGTTDRGGQFGAGTVFTISIPEPCSLWLASTGFTIAVIAFAYRRPRGRASQ
jgi:hypothetical protein